MQEGAAPSRADEVRVIELSKDQTPFRKDERQRILSNFPDVEIMTLGMRNGEVPVRLQTPLSQPPRHASSSCSSTQPAARAAATSANVHSRARQASAGTAGERGLRRRGGPVRRRRRPATRMDRQAVLSGKRLHTLHRSAARSPLAHRSPPRPCTATRRPDRRAGAMYPPSTPRAQGTPSASRRV